MRASVPRATFIALRARRQAYHVAADILYDHAIDVRQIECPACHSPIEPTPGELDVAACTACGQRVPLPCHLRLRPVRKLTSDEVARLAEDVRLTVDAEAQAAREERRELWRYLIVGAAVVVAIFLLAYYLRPQAGVPSGF